MSLYVVKEESIKYTNYDKIDLFNSLQNPDFHNFAKKNFNIQKINFITFPHTIKFRRWKQTWPLPKNLSIELEKINYSNSRAYQKIIKRTLWAEIESLSQYNSNTKKPSSYWRGSIPLRIINNKVNIKLHNNWFFDFAPQRLDFMYQNNWLQFKIHQDKVALNYYSKDNHNNFIMLPRFLKLDNFFFEGLGLQQGDGTQAFDNVHITFTNSNLDLILHQIKWFENLGINKSALRFYPELPDHVYNAKFEKTKNRLLDYGIKELQFRKPKIGKNCKKPNIQIVFHNRLFKVLYLFLLINMRKILLMKNEFITSYLKGLFASEGCVRTDNLTGIPLTIKLSVKSKQRREFYRNCLNTVGINTSKDELTPNSESIIITHSDNFKKIYNYKLLSLHKEKENIFFASIKKYKKIKIMEDY